MLFQKDTGKRHFPDDFTMLSVLNIKGQRIATHRSIHRLPFRWSHLMIMVFVPLVFNIATWRASGAINAFWVDFFEFWSNRLGLMGTIALKASRFGWVTVTLPYLEVASSAPDGFRWSVILGLSIVALLLTFFLPDKLLPLNYLIRSAVFVQLTTLLLFALVPAVFPYTVTGYFESFLMAGVWFIFLLPWVHALTYYIFDFSLARKIWFTLLSLLFLVVAMPFQLMAHSFLLVKCSLLVLPVLFLMFGLLLDILACIALYGWAMSWKCDQ